MSAKIAVLGLVIEESGPPHRLTAKLRQRLASAEFVDSNVYSALTRLEREGFVRPVGADDADSDSDSAQPASARQPTSATQPASAAQPRSATRAASAAQPVSAASPPSRRARLALVGESDAAPRPAGRSGRAGLSSERPARRRPVGRRSPGARGDTRAFEATPAGVRHFEQWLLGSSSAPPLRDELHMKVALCQPHNLPRLIELVYGQELVCLARVQELRRSFQRVAPPTPDRWSGLVLVHVRDAELSFWEARLTWLQGVRESLERMRSEYEGARRRVP